MSSSSHIPVRMGSHQFHVIGEGEMKCSELIEQVIAKCRLYGNEKLARTYAVYERVNGVERRVRRGEDVLRLAREQKQAEFVVRKLSHVEKQLMREQRACSTGGQRAKMAERCYRRLRKMNARSDETPAHIEVYEDIDRNERLESERIREMIRLNERVLQQQSEKLVMLDESIVKHFTSNGEKEPRGGQEVPQKLACKSCCHMDKVNLRQNIGVLRSLYSKLRALHAKKLVADQSISSTSSRALLIDHSSGMNSCGNSSSDETEFSAQSRTSSTSTLESLV